MYRRTIDSVPVDRYRRQPWPLAQVVEPIIDEVLDDKFESPHIHTYEHERYDAQASPLYERVVEGELQADQVGTGSLAPEERKILSVLQSLEAERLVRILGDVGVGKSTFVRHLIDVHLNTEAYGKCDAIYINWNKFTASVVDPLPAIYRWFQEHVHQYLDDTLSEEELLELDYATFNHDQMFAPERQSIRHLPPGEREAQRGRVIAQRIREEPAKFAVARLNELCREDRNRFLVFFDNIDHLPPPVVRALWGYIIQLQLTTTPVIVVALRDHTQFSVSAYEPAQVVKSWYIELRPPRIDTMLERRLEYFFPLAYDGGKKGKQMPVGTSASIQTPIPKIQEVCRSILVSPTQSPKTLEFLAQWSNYNIRELFSALSEIVYNGGWSEATSLPLKTDPFPVSIDHCLLCLALGRNRLFYPRSDTGRPQPLFNPYSLEVENDLTDKLVAVRLLEYLAANPGLVKLVSVKFVFDEFGYDEKAVRTQLGAMLKKDVLWSTAGGPSEVDDTTSVTLSHRGKLYYRQLCRRATFNWIMSFSVYPTADHTFRNHPSISAEELENVTNFGETLEATYVAERVLSLAKIIQSAEVRELNMLRGNRKMETFVKEFQPRSLTYSMLQGLSKFAELSSPHGKPTRPTAPVAGSLVQDIEDMLNEVKARLAKNYVN